MKFLKEIKIIKLESDATTRSSMNILPLGNGVCKVIFIDNCGNKLTLSGGDSVEYFSDTLITDLVYSITDLGIEIDTDLNDDLIVDYINGLALEKSNKEIYCIKIIGSTENVLKKYLVTDLPKGIVVITKEQLLEIPDNDGQGEKGDPFLYSDFTPQQLESLKVKGDKGDDFKYEDFTSQQLDSLKVKGDDGKSISVIQASNETDAINLSSQNPNNVYYW